MAACFLDASAVVKRYVTEVGSTWVQALCDPSGGNDIFLVNIGGVEVVSALVRQVPAPSPVDLGRTLADFQTDYQGQYQLVIVTQALIARAMGLAEKHRLRAYDAVQLAGGLELLGVASATGISLTFVSADKQLNLAAAAEGLVVDNPLDHP